MISSCPRHPLHSSFRLHPNDVAIFRATDHERIRARVQISNARNAELASPRIVLAWPICNCIEPARSASCSIRQLFQERCFRQLRGEKHRKASHNQPQGEIDSALIRLSRPRLQRQYQRPPPRRPLHPQQRPTQTSTPRTPATSSSCPAAHPSTLPSRASFGSRHPQAYFRPISPAANPTSPPYAADSAAAAVSGVVLGL